jgi:hypothetical protein
MARKILKRILGTVLVLVILLVVLVALLPTIASSNGVRRAVLKKVNSGLDGELDIEKWSIGWRSGVRLDGISFADNAGKVSVKVDSVIAPISVPSLLGSVKDLGHIEIVKPVIVAIVAPSSPAAPGEEEPVAVEEPSAEPERAAEPAHDVPGAEQKPIPFELVFKFDITDGSIVLRTADAEAAVEISDLNVSVDCQGLDQPISFRAGAVLGESVFEADGSVTPLSDGVFDPDKFSADCRISLKDFALGPVVALAKPMGNVPDVSGSLGINITMKADGIRRADCQGRVGLKALKLSGGPLGEDAPSFDSITMEFFVAASGDVVKVDSFMIESSIVKASASGEIGLPSGDNIPEGLFSWKGGLDIAALAAMLPNTLKLKEGLQITGGVLKTEGKITSEGDRQEINAAVVLAELAGELNGRRVPAVTPIELVAKASLSKGVPRLDSLKVESSFLNGAGSGDLDELDLALSVNLANAMGEAGKFVELGKLKVLGIAELELALRTPEESKKAISAKAALKSLRVSGIGRKSIFEKLVDVKFDSAVTLNSEHKPTAVSGTRLELDCSLAKAALDIADIKLEPGSDSMPQIRLSAKAELDLKRIGEVAVCMTNVPADLALDGTASLVCPVEVDGDSIRVGPISATIASFVFKQGGKRMSEKEISVSGVVSANKQTRTASVKNLEVGFTPGHLKVADVTIEDWEKLPAGLKVGADCGIDIAKLITMLGDFATLREGTSIGGQASFNLNVAAGAKTQDIKLSGTIDKLAIKSSDREPIEEPRIELDGLVRIDPEASDVRIESFKLTSNPIGLKAAGELTDWKERKHLVANGELTIDFTRLAAIAGSLSGQEIDMAGKKPAPFSVDVVLSGKDWKEIFRSAKISAGLYVERLSLYGVTVGKLDIPFTASNGIARVAFDTTVNEGKVVVDVTLDATGEVAVVRMPDNSAVLQGVKINSAMVDKILSKIHPVFKGCLISAGRMSLDMKRTMVPLDDVMKKTEIEGEVSLKSLELGPDGLLKTVMALAGQNADNIVPGDQSFMFECKDGWITAEPLKIKSGDVVLIFSGSVGLDQTLKYNVEIPVTRAMGGDVYQYLEGVTIKIPIGGTVSKPTIDRQAFSKALGGLMKDAAKKAAVNVLEREAGKLIEGLFR